MLNDLDKLNWDAIGEPIIPKLLRGLISKQSSVRRDAIRSISVYIIREDDMYGDLNVPRPAEVLSNDGIVHIVPFLIYLLDSHETPEKIAIVSFLNSLASYHSHVKDLEGQYGVESEHVERAKKIYHLIRESTHVYQKQYQYANSMLDNEINYLLDTLELSHLKKNDE